MALYASEHKLVQPPAVKKALCY